MPARILVVDDLPVNRRLLEAKLSQEYFDVVTAESGEKALELVREELPDLVLLDVMMPGMDGFEVCRRIRSDPAVAHVPVIMVTALSDASDRVTGLEAGADDFLTKPINDLALISRVKSLVRLKMIVDELRLREGTDEQFGVIAHETLADTGALSGAKVMLVEDKRSAVKQVGALVDEAGYALSVAGDAESALATAAGADLDLILVSLHLGSGDALRLCSRLRSQDETRYTPILLMIEQTDTARLAKGLELGVNDYIVRPPLDRGELLARMRTQIRRRRYQDRLRANYRDSLSAAANDALTGLYNRRYLDIHLPAQLKQAADNGKSLSLLMIDIDHFKAVNDTHGHAVGDEVLRETARRLAENMRSFDTVGRFGGEEFLVMLPAAGPPAALAAADRLRTKVAATPISVSGEKDLEVSVTISIGIAHSDPGNSAENILRRADEALYEAKRAGRNRVVSAEDMAPSGKTLSSGDQAHLSIA